MPDYTRRWFLHLGAAGLAALGLGLSSRAKGKELKAKMHDREIPVSRNQSEDAAGRLGANSEALDNLTRLFKRMIEEERHPGAQLAVFRQGELVIELAGGFDAPSGRPITTDTLFQIRSTTKALAAMVMLRLHDQGRFSFEDPVARHWPEFGQNGKQSITIAQIMSHSAGIPDGPLVSARQMADRAVVAAAVEAMEPIWPPGTANGYHSASYGWVLDELVYRWKKGNVARVLHDELTSPLGIQNIYLGLPKEAFARMTAMVVEDDVRERQPGRARFSDFMNTYEGVRLPLSWVGGLATARDLADLMNVLAFEGTFKSRTFFSRETQRTAGSPRNAAGEMDRRLNWPVRWGLGFILGDTPHIYGTPPHPQALGHAGGGAGVAWADPEQQLAVAFLCNRMLGGTRWWERYREIGDQVYTVFR
ncbi:MAG: serine hydrolase domain-containing protein [Candidatus Adiutricales bacterium]